jgi:ankyrin repeat protein
MRLENLRLVFLVLWQLTCFCGLDYGQSAPLRFAANKLVAAPVPQASPQERELVRAIQAHDLVKVEKLLSLGLNPNYLSVKSSGSPLTEAIVAGEFRMVALLLKHGADVNLGAEEGDSPLAAAAWYGDVNVVAELLKRGAKTEVRDNEGYTPLLLAASHGQDTAILRALIAAGADLRATSPEGTNALMLAAMSQNVKAVRLFIDLGIDPCARNQDGNSAAHYANFRIVKSPSGLKSRRDILNILSNRCSEGTNPTATPAQD